MEDIFSCFINEDAYPDLDADGAVGRLSEAVRCETLSAAPAEGAFERIHRIIRTGYPHVMAAGTFETVRNSVLITIPGTDSSLKPALFMSHLDVVPVVGGTEDDWRYDPFSGAVAEGYIWGRGTEDIKQQVFGCLEAAEYLLSKGFRPERTLLLAFGDDEETYNDGSKMISDLLKSRGVTLEFLLDEGGGKLKDGACFGAPGVAVSDINLMEKGYADLELSVESRGGHSSRPFGGTSLGILSCAIADICRNPFPTEAGTLLLRAFEELKDAITAEPVRSIMADGNPDPERLAEYCAGNEDLFPFTTTTVAPTVIEGGSSACNVMPQNMRAVINFRLAENCTPEDVMAHCRSVVGDDRVRMHFLQSNPPSIVSDSESFGYRNLTESLNGFYENVRFIPMATAGATDARNYEQICGVCLRCSPFFIPEEDIGGVHGTNERMSIRSYIQGIRVLIRMMENTLKK